MTMQPVLTNDNNGLSVQAAQIISLAAPPAQGSNEKPYIDYFEHLDALERETILILANAIDSERSCHIRPAFRFRFSSIAKTTVLLNLKERLFSCC